LGDGEFVLCSRDAAQAAYGDAVAMLIEREKT
jgi:hypothetical protein